MFFNSIRFRLQLWYSVILVAVLAGFGFTAYQLERGKQLRRVDEALEQRAGFVANEFRPQPRDRGPDAQSPLSRPRRQDERPGFGFGGPRYGGPRGPGDLSVPPLQSALFDETDTNGFYYILWSRGGTELARSTNAPPAVPVPLVPSRPGVTSLRLRGEFREFARVIPRGDTLLVGRSIAPELADLRRAALKLASAGGVILLLGFAGGWWIATRAIKPIDQISATAAKIAAGDLSQRINVTRAENELGRLATVLNSTFARLDAAFAQQKQFTSNAAHELRTPVSVILTQTQTTLTRDRSAGEYRDTLEACQRAAQRMRRLIESLLVLARLDAGQEPMKHLPFDLAQTARDCVDLIQPLADQHHVAIHSNLAPAPCVGDPEHLARVITNLLTNAIQYNTRDGELRISTASQNHAAILTVTDTGPGIAPDDLPRVFERFYRADQSRSSDHAGLGLAISKAIVDAHGGTIDVASKPGSGATFAVRLPAP